MGHERLGLLPKTKRWRDIVADISATNDVADVSGITERTLNALGSRYERLSDDPGIEAAFAFLVELSSAAAGNRSTLKLAGRTPLSLLPHLSERLSSVSASLETSELARRAVADALVRWNREHAAAQGDFFSDQSQEHWLSLGTGAGFCELSRLFFSGLTERYLNYFLEREASGAIPTLRSRDVFRAQVHTHLADVSKHAFETAKITQSFSAGWFNKYAVKGVPTKSQLKRFLSYAFYKMREDLRRERRA